jgi:hypothetical protein
MAKAFNQSASSNVTSAASTDIQRNSRDELQMIHERPNSVGFLLTPLNLAITRTVSSGSPPSTKILAFGVGVNAFMIASK